MYCGVPNIDPICVAADEEAAESRSGPSSACGEQAQRLARRRASRAGSCDVPLPAPRPWPAPIDDQRLAESPQHDVVRLDIPVQHIAAVGIGDGIAGVDERLEQLAEVERKCGCGVRMRRA